MTLVAGLARARRRAPASLPPRVAAYVLAVQAAGLLALVLAVRVSPLRAHDLLVFGVLTGCACACVEGSRHLGAPSTRRDRPYKDMLSAWMLPVALLLPPVYAVLVPVPVYLYVQLRVTRIAVVKRLFNTSSVAVAGYLASGLHRLLAGQPDAAELLGSPPAAAAVLLSALTFAAVSAYLVAGVLRRLTPGLSRRAAFGGWSLHSTEGAELCIGILVALCCLVNPLLALLALPPMLLLQRTLLHAELVQAARTDAKTGLANPRHWREVADREIARSRRGQQPLAVLLVDIDRFKTVNDTFGHLIGDRVLCAVAEQLEAAVRPMDLVGRFGGEEFVLLLADASPDAAVRTAERVRQRVQHMRLPTADDTAWSITVSVGVASLGPDGENLEQLLQSADTAMYAAKDAGRNRVGAAPDPAPERTAQKAERR